MQEDIEELKEFIEDYRNAEEFVTGDIIEAIENLIARNKELESIEQAHKEENGKLREQNKEIAKKDKVINLMAEQLTTPINGKEWIINYYEKEVEDNK